MSLKRNNKNEATPKFALVAFRDSLSTKILDVNELKGPKCKVSGATVKVDDDKTGLVGKGTIVSISVDKEFLEKQKQSFDCRKFFGVSKCHGKTTASGGTVISKSAQTKKGKAPRLQAIANTALPIPRTEIPDRVPSASNKRKLSLESSKNIPTAPKSSKIVPAVIQVVVHDDLSSNTSNQDVQATEVTQTISCTMKTRSFRCDSFNNMSSMFNVSSLSPTLSHGCSLSGMTPDPRDTSTVENLKLSEILEIIEPPTQSIAGPLLEEEGGASYAYTDFREARSDVGPTEYDDEEEDGYSPSSPKDVEESTEDLDEVNHLQSCTEVLPKEITDTLEHEVSMYSSTPMELYNELGNSHLYSRLHESQLENKQVLQAIRTESSRPEIFARNLLYRMFTLNELRNCNVYGRGMQDGKPNGRLDAKKVKIIYKQTLSMFFEMRFSWRNCVLVMNRSIQHVLRAFLPRLHTEEAPIVYKSDAVGATPCDASLNLTICSIGSSVQCITAGYTSENMDVSVFSHEVCQPSKHLHDIHSEITGHPLMQSTPRRFPSPRKAPKMTLLKRMLIVNNCYRYSPELRLQLTPMELYSQLKECVPYPKIDKVMLQKPNIIDAIFAMCSRPEAFSRELIFRVFTLDELSMCYVYGRSYTKEKHNERLDARMVSTIRKLTCEKFSDVRFSWRNCVLMINKSIRCLSAKLQ